MPKDLQKDSNLVPAKIAAREAGYTTDYVALLAREGKIAAQKIGRQWHVNLNEVLHFAYKADKEQLTRQAQLKAERKIEYALHVRNIDEEISERINTGKELAILMASLVLMLTCSLGAFGYYSNNQVQLAALPQVDLTPLEEVALDLYRFVTPKQWYADRGGAASGGTDSSVQRSRSYTLTSVPSIEDEQAIIRDAFSDDLEVVFDAEASDSGVIIPKFKSDTESKYRFRILLEEIMGGSS